MRAAAAIRALLCALVLLALGCHERSVLSIEPYAPACERTPIRPSFCQGSAISPDGHLVACLSPFDSLGIFTPSALRITILGTGTSRVVLRDTLGFGLFTGVQWAPDGKHLLLQSGALFLSLFDLETGLLSLNFIHESPPDRRYASATWAPSGDSIYYEAGYNRIRDAAASPWLRVASKDGTGVHWVSFGNDTMGSMAAPVAFDRAGRRMAVATYKDRPDYPTTMYISNIDGSHLRQIAEFYGDIERVFWIDNDRTLAFGFVPHECIGPGSTMHTYLMDVETGKMRRAPVDFGDPRVQFGFDPQFTPDQRKLAFIGLDERLGYGVLQTMNIDGSDRRSVYAPHVQSPLFFDPRDPQPNIGGPVRHSGPRGR